MAAVSPRVTVILTVYNAGTFLRAAIQSVFDQTFEDWELLAMDDGSTDSLVPMILSEATYDRRVRVERFDPMEMERFASVRYATNINWGAARTTGEYITYLAGDDYYLPDRLERMVAKADEGFPVVYGTQVMLRESGVKLGVRPPLADPADAWQRVDLNSVLHTRESFNRVGGWPTDPSMWRDADAFMWKKLTDAGYRFELVDGGPTDCKTYRDCSVDARVQRGETPW
jgi:glycosyltransferase involved in cell wall biosynthesis